MTWEDQLGSDDKPHGFDKPAIALYNSLAALRATGSTRRKSVATDGDSHPPPSKEEGRIGFLGVFASPAVESAFRGRHFRDDLWLGRLLVTAGMLRVALLLVADYRQFGVGTMFWLLFTSRLLFILVSAATFAALGRAPSAAAANRLFFGWGFLLVALTVSALSARPPGNNALLLMSFGMIVVIYCIAPLPLFRQATLALSYSALALYGSRQTDGATLGAVGATYAMSHLFGAVTSWRLNHRRREAFLGALREAGLRASLEAALAEVRTLRGLLCMCAWCKRIRDGADVWESVEDYVQSRTHVSFSHGICPDCLQSQVGELAQSGK